MVLSQHTPAGRVPARRLSRRRDSPGYRYALLRSLYALLLVLLLLLPANFIAYALSYSTNDGSALAGLFYAVSHHHTGYFAVAQGQVSVVAAANWWAGAAWEVLLALSCVSAVVLLILWSVRLLLAWLARGASARRTLTTARAA